MTETIIWRRLDMPGHESARVFLQDSRWQVDGSAVFVYEREPCRLDYRLECNSDWETLSGEIAGWVGDKLVRIEISVDADRRWWLNGAECFEVTGCIDLDLNFSPVTNLFPIRRLKLAVGERSAVRAAWLRFPSFKFERLDQTYSRLDNSTYRYESAGGSFVSQLAVNDAGLVTHYPDFWRVEEA
jgi:hypothetical protein